jgi:hypothetical protein
MLWALAKLKILATSRSPKHDGTYDSSPIHLSTGIYGYRSCQLCSSSTSTVGYNDNPNTLCYSTQARCNTSSHRSNRPKLLHVVTTKCSKCCQRKGKKKVLRISVRILPSETEFPPLSLPNNPYQHPRLPPAKSINSRSQYIAIS